MSAKTNRFVPYEEKHFFGCVDLVMSTWNFHSSFMDVPCNRIIYEYYLKTCLNWNHHLDVIVDEHEQVIGILFGSKEDTSFIEELKFSRKDRLNNKWKNKKIQSGHFGNKEVANRELARFAMNDVLGEKDASLFDGEVNLFIVSQAYQGQGLGKQLMDRYLNFCRSNKLKIVFLWTDEDCNHAFYSRYGFSLHKRFNTFTSYRVKSLTENGMVLSLPVRGL
ncbi:GNAT family N-acetyltransferase [Vibrio tapetis]|uniref:Acetyltransferase family protein n=1 Tax=Vibrio tapetis subsp. tapetis TaxID=1671868 RepID=A0A2N8ZJN0_9VIBR|nr:GNAT family N-acetyltransferase [Vibrio tapetis]SON52076.1 Acetyltransferase family protein [Vibrio tapetis subsp. tapetis]